jgi:hypothetical protein
MTFRMVTPIEGVTVQAGGGALLPNVTDCQAIRQPPESSRST